MKTLVRKLLVYGIFKPFYWVAFSYPFWYRVTNRQAVRLWQSKDSPLNSLQKRLRDEMLENGIALTSLAELFPEENVLEHLQNYVSALNKDGHQKKGFLHVLEGKDGSIIDFANPMVQIALRPYILDIANAYMGMAAKLFFYFLAITKVIDKNAVPIKSQRWHRDPNDLRMFKMFIYLSDVDATAGPFRYVRKSNKYNAHWELHKNVIPNTRRLTDSEEHDIPEQEILTCVGKAGTVIFADTTGLHRGGYATEKERIMFTAEYSSPSTLLEAFFKIPWQTEYALQRPPLLARTINKIYQIQNKHCRY